MTAALTTTPATATPAAPAAARQLRWLLRLHRPALVTGTVATLLLGAALLWLGGPLTDASAGAWKDFNACGFNPRCSYDQDSILLYKDLYTYTTFAVLVVPFLIAAWAGGSLTGRETESGTARLAWTQGVSPVRWLVSRLTFPAALTVTATGLTAWLHRRAWTAGEHRIDTIKPWYDAATFYANGTVPVALALTGLALGVLAGLLLRRAMAALATATVALGVLWALVHAALPYLWSPVTKVSALTAGPSGSGLHVGEGVLTADGDRLAAPCLSGAMDSCRATLDELGAVSFYRDFHPAAHYWPLQLVASGILLAVAALLTYAAFQVVRRTTATARG
ncbi:ABC transporter permease [Streptomyces pseudogriseolus]|uniref:ABC transporter permease n=1 Tax=Streptomyces pseudogriseolus TaxID=36817 RepID=UPI00348D313D